MELIEIHGVAWARGGRSWCRLSGGSETTLHATAMVAVCHRKFVRSPEQTAPSEPDVNCAFVPWNKRPTWYGVDRGGGGMSVEEQGLWKPLYHPPQLVVTLKLLLKVFLNG